MSSFTGVTREVVLPNHNPNEGRDIWNRNFANVWDTVLFTITGSTSAHTQVDGSSNIDSFSSGATVPPIYTIYLKDDIILDSVSATSISATSYYIGSTLLNPEVTPAPQYFVTATGDTICTASSTPALTTGYTLGDLYITTFLSANTATGVTINIDSQGIVSVEKYDSDLSGFTSLDIGDIQPTVNYYLSYDEERLQFLESEPSNTPGTYTNPLAVPTTIGGVEAGTVFNATPFSDVFDDLFYPYVSPNFTSFLMTNPLSTTSVEVGYTLPSGSTTFTWKVSNTGYIQANSILIRNVTGGIVNLYTGLTSSAATNTTVVTLPSSIQKTTPTLHTWQIRGTRTNSVAFARNLSVNWYWKVYYGTSSLTGLTSAQITGLTSSNLDTTVINDTRTFVAGDYKYLCIPSTFVEPTLFKDNNTNLSIAMADTTEGYSAGTSTYKYNLVSVLNQYGISQNYKVFRTRNILGGSLNIKTT